jgi:hypothetical protein
MEIVVSCYEAGITAWLVKTIAAALAIEMADSRAAGDTGFGEERELYPAAVRISSSEDSHVEST